MELRKSEKNLHRLKMFDNFEELNISSLVETGGETILLLSEKLGNISNVVFSNSSYTTGHVLNVVSVTPSLRLHPS